MLRMIFFQRIKTEVFMLFCAVSIFPYLPPLHYEMKWNEISFRSKRPTFYSPLK